MANKKPICKYGDKCFRKNKEHIKNYEHTSFKKDDDSSDEFKDIKDSKQETLDNLAKNSENLAKKSEIVMETNTMEIDKLEKFDLSSLKGL